MPDRSGRGRHLGVEVNWSEGVKPARLLRFFDQQGNEYLVDRKELLSIMFLFGDADDQMHMVSPTLHRQTVKHFEVKFKAQQHYRKGDEVTAHIEIPVNTEIIVPQRSVEKSDLRRIS